MFYDRASDELIGEVLLPQLTLSRLQDNLCIDKDNPMYDCFQVKPVHVDFFKSITDIHFEFEKYDYFFRVLS